MNGKGKKVHAAVQPTRREACLVSLAISFLILFIVVHRRLQLLFFFIFDGIHYGTIVTA